MKCQNTTEEIADFPSSMGRIRKADGAIGLRKNCMNKVIKNATVNNDREAAAASDGA